MTRDDVILMAREAGCDVQEGYVAYCDIDDLCELVRLAAAAEREACVELCNVIARRVESACGFQEGAEAATECADAIRARSTT